MRSVSGLLLTTANFAEVVSGLPTSGLKAKTRGASGASGSSVRRAFVEQQPYTQPAAADELAQNRVRQRHMLGGAARNVDAKVAAVVTERHRFLTLPRRRKESARSRLRRAGFRVADEPIAVQVGDKRRVQPVHGDEFA